MSGGKVPLLLQRDITIAIFLSKPRSLHPLEGQREFKKMATPLVVSIPHSLGRQEATRRLQFGLSRAAASIPILKVDEEHWDGDHMFFRVRALGQTASGHVDVADDHVRLEVMLPWLLQRFAEVAQTAIRNRGRLLLEKRK